MSSPVRHVYVYLCLSDPGWRSQRAATPCVLRAVAAVGHTPLSGFYDNNRADLSPHPPPTALHPHLQQDGQPQVQQKHLR